MGISSGSVYLSGTVSLRSINSGIARNRGASQVVRCHKSSSGWSRPPARGQQFSRVRRSFGHSLKRARCCAYSETNHGAIALVDSRMPVPQCRMHRPSTIAPHQRMPDTLKLAFRREEAHMAIRDVALAGLSRDQLLDHYYQMWLIRHFEEKAAEGYTLGKIGGFLHLYIGQEAVATGIIAQLRRDDVVISSYREHGHALVKGVHPNAVMAELYGKATGCSKGKGGSMHIYDAATNMLGGYAIVAGQLPLACGYGLAAQYQHQDWVTITFFGDGAVDEGAFHESLNLAELWSLPVVFVCENNLYSMGNALQKAWSVNSLEPRAAAYGMTYEQVDGMDVLAVHAAAERAIAH